MKIDPPSAEIARAAIRALKTVAMADGTFHDLERGFIDSIQRNVLKTDFDLETLEPIGGEELARIVPEGVYRERILRGSILTALMDAKASDVEAKVVRGFAEALHVDLAPLRSLEQAAAGRMTLLRFDIARRSFLGRRVGQHVGAKGFRGLAEIAGSVLGVPNAAMATRYQSLEQRAPGTLGRAYWDFIKGNEFSLPGEKGGAPEPIVFHDCVHVLAEYGTTAEEEVLVITFQAGFQNYDPFFSMLFAFAQFHLGIGISPVAAKATFAIDPDAMGRALVRGSKCNRDLSDHWDPWEDFDVPVEELRRRYNIEPRV